MRLDKWRGRLWPLTSARYTHLRLLLDAIQLAHMAPFLLHVIGASVRMHIDCLSGLTG